MDHYKFFALGDQAIVVDFGNVIDETINNKVISFFDYLKANPFSGFIEAVPAFCSVTVFFDAVSIRKKLKNNETVMSWVENSLRQSISTMVVQKKTNVRLMKIPVCYDDEFAPDLRWVADQKNLSVKEVIQSHTSKTYRVYMMGFLPGFAYMGEVNENITVPRKTNPRIKIDIGSVGLAGKQTGIYPLASPGGWQIIGRTPLKLFDPRNVEPTLLRSGDQVMFHSISKECYLSIINHKE